MDLVESLKSKIKKEGRSYKWFCLTYLPDMKYMTVMAQMNGFNTLQPEVLEAVKKYLEE